MDARPDRHDTVAGALAAAVEVGRAAGFDGSDPVVLQDSNNVVAWLAPHPIVAKVGVFDHSADALEQEVAVAAHVAEQGVAIARPLGPIERSAADGLPVTLWERVDGILAEPVDAAALAHLLATVWVALAAFPGELPGYEATLDHAAGALVDDRAMQALAPEDLRLLRAAFARHRGEVAARTTHRQPLHGEPHPGNVLTTGDGLVFLDFEGTCTGPKEWDLAAAPPEVAGHVADVDRQLLTSARLLRSAFVAVWGWVNADHPDMRRHGEHHLALLRAEAASRP